MLYIGCYMRPPINIAPTYLALHGLRNITGLDKFMSDQDLNIIKGDALKPFGQNKYDTIIAGELIEHFDKEEATAFLLNCKRALRKDGILIITTPNKGALLNRIFHKYDTANCGGVSPHKKVYEIEELVNFIEKNGFCAMELMMLPYDSESSPDHHRLVYILRKALHYCLPDILRENIVIKSKRVGVKR